MSNTYVIYYGWLADEAHGEPNDEARAIAAAKAPLLIAHAWTAEPDRHRNLSPQVLSLMRDAGTPVFAYVATNSGKARLDDVVALVDDCLDGGADGLFFDEADPLRDEARFEYYGALAKRIRDRGKRVILNPGVAQCGERIMEAADYVMVEHQWRNLRSGSLWSFRYPADRFMGVSSNEGNAMTYVVDRERALADTREAWQRGIGWHTSTDTYIELPEWFAAYHEAVRGEGS
jgi:hypothetical protein